MREGHILCDGLVGACKDSGKFFDEMRSIAGLLELLDDGDDDVITNAFGVNFVGSQRICGGPGSIRGRRGRRRGALEHAGGGARSTPAILVRN